MTGAALTFVDPGPFDRITAFAFPAVSWRLRIVRDDGLLFAPESAEGVEIALYDESWELLFLGNSWADPELHYAEEIPGLIVGFGYHDAHYTVTFNLAVVREVLNRNGNDIRVHVGIDGDRTLETFHPRCYAAGQEPFAISPGRHDILLPFWDKVTETTFLDLTTVSRVTTFHSSIPHSVRYSIGAANALGRFQFPVLVVVWSANASLDGWSHAFRFSVNCTGMKLYLPAQTVAGLTPPEQPPVSPADQVTCVYANLVLSLALGSCSGAWNSTRIGVTSSFGCSATIPFTDSGYDLFNLEYDLPGILEPNLLGENYARTWQFLWNRSSFAYDTGVWPLYYTGRTAWLVQSPPAGYDALHFFPQPE